MFSIDWDNVGEKVNSEILKKGMSSAAVAMKAGVDRRTVDRIRQGQRVRIQTLSWVEQSLNLDLINPIEEQNGNSPSKVAPNELGAYSFESYQEYAGNYFMFRNSYDDLDRIVCSYIEIYWDLEARCFKFRERQRNTSKAGRKHSYDFSGRISIPPGVGIIQFVTSVKGMNRIITTTILRDLEKPYMRGILSGINEITDIGFYPVVSPVFISKIKDKVDFSYVAKKIGSFPVKELWSPEALKELREGNSRFSAFYG